MTSGEEEAIAGQSLTDTPTAITRPYRDSDRGAGPLQVSG